MKLMKNINSKNSENWIINLLSKYKKKSLNLLFQIWTWIDNRKIAKFISKNKFNYNLNAQINSANRGYHGLFKFKNADTIQALVPVN